MILEWGTTVMACNYEILSVAAITNIIISSSVLAETLFQALHLVAAICFGFAVRRYHRYARSCVLSTWHVTCFCSASAGFLLKIIVVCGVFGHVLWGEFLFIFGFVYLYIKIFEKYIIK